MVRYFIAAAAICSATSLVTRSEAAEQQIPRHLRKLYYTTSISATESVPTYYPTYYPTSSPTTEVVAETTTSLVKTVSIKDDSWKCASEISEVRNSSIRLSLVTSCSPVIQSNFTKSYSPFNLLYLPTINRYEAGVPLQLFQRSMRCGMAALVTLVPKIMSHFREAKAENLVPRRGCPRLAPPTPRFPR
jgi:hypothetical protein